MPLSPKIDPPEATRGNFLNGLNNILSGFWQKWFNQAYQALMFLLAGTAESTQANLAKVTASLDKQDQGYKVEITDYSHVLEWTGTGWQFAAGDSGSGYVASFLFAPTWTGWHLLDGSTVSYLRPDGTLGSMVLPTVPGMYFRQ